MLAGMGNHKAWLALPSLALVAGVACAKGSTSNVIGGQGASGAASPTGGSSNGGSGGSGGDGETCAAVTCDPHASCDTTNGTPLCTCDPGYSGNGQSCSDVDECANAPCGPGTCDNTPGSYTCNCNPGYEEQGGTCVPTDECTVNNGGCVAGCTCADTPNAPPTCSCVLSHSSSNAVTAGNSASCSYSASLENAENSYYRVYDLAALGITGAFSVSSVDVGIEQATSFSGTQPATLRLQTLNGALLVANMSPLVNAPITVLDSAGVVTSFPVSALVATGAKLVVELYTPDGLGTGNLFYIGSNASAETDASYVRAPTCGLLEPTTTAAIAFPSMHTVLNVRGTYSP